jgi:hypothetical protein
VREGGETGAKEAGDDAHLHTELWQQAGVMERRWSSETAASLCLAVKVAARLGFTKQEAATAGFTESRARGGGFIGWLRVPWRAGPGRRVAEAVPRPDLGASLSQARARGRG